MWQALISNQVLVTGFFAWIIAQFLKVIIFRFEKHRWNWGLFFSAGGMPSSHSALITSVMLAIGLFVGFASPLFGLAVAITMIVVYDAAGVRRQAGFHAEKINQLINEFFAGHPISEKQLKEVLGHTPRQVVAGTALGFTTAVVVWLLW